jgi:hypothetical protein
MKPDAMTWPTFARELLRARATLHLGTEVGLALRADRRRLGLSQRGYAEHRGRTPSAVARLETAALDMKVADVVAALEGTPFMLCLCHRPVTEPAAADALPAPRAASTEPRPVHPAFWPRAELIARVRGGRRRFPAHHEAAQVSSGPPWWWDAESTRAGAKPPNWYAPRLRRLPPAS